MILDILDNLDKINWPYFRHGYFVYLMLCRKEEKNKRAILFDNEHSFCSYFYATNTKNTLAISPRANEILIPAPANRNWNESLLLCFLPFCESCS